MIVRRVPLTRQPDLTHGVMALPRTLFALAGIVLSALTTYGASPPVTVSLRSSFTASDPLLEAL